MKVTVVYDGGCPFCADYVRFQRLREAAGEIELVDARADRAALERLRITPAQLEDGMVVILGDERLDGADAVNALSRLSESPARWWVRLVAAASRSPSRARALYPVLRAGRRVALALLGIKRFR